MFQIEKISGSESGFELSVSDLLKHGKRWHPDLISSVSDPNPSLVGELDIFYIQNPFSKVNTDLLGVKNWALLEMLSASTTHRRGCRFTSGEPKYIFTEHLQDGEREQPILPGCRRDPMRTRESVWRQSFLPFPQIQLHIPCPPSSIFVPRSWAAQGRWGPDAVSGSIIRAEGDLVSMIYSCGRLHVPCHSTQLQSDVSTFTGWIWNSAYYWRWIINLCLILLISVVKVPTNFLPKFFFGN